MKKIIDRRNLLRQGLMTIGGMALAPHLTMGAFPTAPVHIDAMNRIVYSPFMQEHFLDEAIAPVITAKLNANENPYGPPASAQKAVKDSISGGNRYAWKEMFDLVSKIAKKEGVTNNHIMMGPGSSRSEEHTSNSSHWITLH